MYEDSEIKVRDKSKTNEIHENSESKIRNELCVHNYAVANMCNDSERILTNHVSMEEIDQNMNNSVNVMEISKNGNINDENRDKVECIAAADFEDIESFISSTRDLLVLQIPIGSSESEFKVIPMSEI